MKVLPSHESLCTNMPLRSFGSNQVDFGGIVSPASAIAITSSIRVGYSENATFIPPATSRSNSCNPRMPPTTSMAGLRGLGVLRPATTTISNYKAAPWPSTGRNTHRGKSHAVCRTRRSMPLTKATAMRKTPRKPSRTCSD